MTATVDNRRRTNAGEPTEAERLAAAVATLRLTERNLTHLLSGGRPDEALLLAWRALVKGAIGVAER